MVWDFLPLSFQIGCRAMLESGWLFLFPCFLLLKRVWQYVVLLSWVYQSSRMKFTCLNLPSAMWRRVRNLRRIHSALWMREWEVPLLSSAYPPAAESYPCPWRMMQIDSQKAEGPLRSCLEYQCCALPFKRYLKNSDRYVFLCIYTYIYM